jgi:fructan beta-fructosidase
VGNFDGHTFTPLNEKTKWADFGPDEYAGVTWANTGARRLFLGWMSNWEYANQAPTSPWRSAMTVPRELALQQVGPEIYLTSQPAKEVDKLFPAPTTLRTLSVGKEYDLSAKLKNTGDKYELKLTTSQLASFSLVVANGKGEELVIGYDKAANQYFIDRSKAGLTSFSPKFGGRHTAPRFATAPAADVRLLFDATSVEVFADRGLTVMTELFFPTAPLTKLTLRTPNGLMVQELTYSKAAGQPK